MTYKQAGGSVVMETLKYRGDVSLPDEYIVLASAEEEHITVQKLNSQNCNDSAIYGVDIFGGGPLVYAKLCDSFEEYFKEFVNNALSDNNPKVTGSNPVPATNFPYNRISCCGGFIYPQDGL